MIMDLSTRPYLLDLYVRTQMRNFDAELKALLDSEDE